MKYKAKDKVRIKSLDWYNENNDTSGILSYKISGIPFTPEMAKYCGCIVTIDKVEVDTNSILGDRYYIKEDDGTWVWHEKMFEGLAEITDERLTEMAEEVFDKEEPFSLHCQYSYDSGNYEWKHEFNCPEGYEFKDENGNVINASKIVLEKKPKYPRSYAECCRIIGALQTRHYFYTKKDAEDDYPNEVKILRKLDYLRELLICRDAYWKIAGDWKLTIGKRFYYLYYNRQIDNIKKDYADDIQGNVILAFPTEEMRDAFYDNFKDLIEECKELL